MWSHEWHPAWQRLHTWLSTYVGPRGSQVQGQLWDSIVLEQWSLAIAIPSLPAAHMGLAGPHDMGTDFVRQVSLESQKVWLAHARAWEGQGPRGTMAWALRELQLHQQAGQQGVPRVALNYGRHTQGQLLPRQSMQDTPAIAIWQQRLRHTTPHHTAQHHRTQHHTTPYTTLHHNAAAPKTNGSCCPQPSTTLGPLLGQFNR